MRWWKASLFEKEGEHDGGGGFSVGAGDDGVVTASEEELSQRFREGDVVEASVQDLFHLWVSPGDGVSDDDEVCGGREIGG